jgi:hypothetical protein
LPPFHQSCIKYIIPDSKTQKTPKGYEIPIPNKEDVFKVLRKAAEPTKKTSETPSRPEKD